jgi:S-adenosylmethionine-dependent methyltransferase
VDTCTVAALDAITAFAVPNPNSSSQSQSVFSGPVALQVTLMSRSLSLLRTGKFLFRQSFQPSTEIKLNSSRHLCQRKTRPKYKYLWIEMWKNRESVVGNSSEWNHTKMSGSSNCERFQSDAQKYAAYLETPEGRLRIDLAFANLREFLPQASQSLRALDVGCGTGAIGVRLARLGLDVTLLDSSASMLDIAESAAKHAGVLERIELKKGEADQMAKLFPAESFDLVVCHNILEFVDDPIAVLRAAARALRASSGMISVLVRNQPGEVLKAALVDGDVAAAEQCLTSEWGDESLYGGKVRLFTRESLSSMLAIASFTVTAERGVRVMSDYLPPKVSRHHEYERIFELERKLAMRPEFAAIARYTHCLAQRNGPQMNGAA